MAANLEDVLPQTGKRWAFHCKIFNTATMLLIMFLLIPSTSSRKLKRLNGIGLYFQRSSHYLTKSPSKLDAAIRIEPGWIL
jgi:NADH:ubiquinone oxidoreductase subunit H